MKIILSFFSLFHTFISALLVLEKERECCTIENRLQLDNFLQLKWTFFQWLKLVNAAEYGDTEGAASNVEDCLILTVLLKLI